MVRQQERAEVDEWVQREGSLSRARYIAQGADANDVDHTLARITRTEDWCREWSASAAVHEELAREAEKSGHMLSAGEAYVRAGVTYHCGKMRWPDDEAQYHEAHRKSTETFEKGLRILDPTFERVEIPYDGITMPAHIRKPQGADHPPVVILLPGMDSVKEEFYPWANVFLERGMAIMAPDGPGQGETRDKRPINYRYEGAGSAMIDFLEKRDDLDVSALGVAGISMGGYYAPRVACFDHRIKALASCSGHFKYRLPEDGVVRANKWGMFTAWAKTPEEMLDKLLERDLEGIIGNITCPYLVVNGRQDQQSSYLETEEIAVEAKRAGVQVEYVMYEEGGHVCFNIPYKYRPLAGDWMADHLLGK